MNKILNKKLSIMQLVSIYKDISKLPINSQKIFSKYIDDLLLDETRLDEIIELNKIINDDTLDGSNLSLFYAIAY